MSRLSRVAVILAGAALLVGGVATVFNPRTLGRRPRGKRLARMKRSPNFANGRFHNRVERPQFTLDGRNFFPVLLWQFLGKHPHRLPATSVPAVKSDVRHLSDRSLVWFGHSSYLMKLSGKSILVDPVFYNANPVDLMGHPFPGTDLYKPEDMPDVIDYLVITHDHYDHLDYKTVRQLIPRVGKVICGLGVGAHLEKWGFPEQAIVELDWFDRYNPAVDGWRFTCFPTHHFSGRFFFPNNTLWTSYVLETPDYSVYIGGDSGYDEVFKEVGDKYPDLDLAIIENGQYGPNWKNIHTMPEHLVDVIRDLGARNVLTVHHSKFSLAQHPWNEPIVKVKELEGQTDSNIIVAMIGEIIPLG